MTDTDFKHNSAPNGGAAFLNAFSALSVLRSNFTLNSATTSAGGLQVQSVVNATVQGCIFNGCAPGCASCSASLCTLERTCVAAGLPAGTCMEATLVLACQELSLQGQGCHGLALSKGCVCAAMWGPRALGSTWALCLALSR